MTFTITDTGCGIPAEDQDRLFLPFEQLQHNRTHDGVGLGASIAKTLTELMEGTLSVRSQVDQGSEFELSIPLPSSSAPHGDGQSWFSIAEPDIGADHLIVGSSKTLYAVPIFYCVKTVTPMPSSSRRC